MTQTIVTCDRCRKRIEADRTRLVVEGSAIVPPWPADPASGRPTLDLCGSCLVRLGEWLEGGTRS